MTLQKILKNDKHAKNISNLFKRQRIRIKMKGLLQINKKKNPAIFVHRKWTKDVDRQSTEKEIKMVTNPILKDASFY